jgi:predicted AAA+ superfamily ATPase
VGYEEQMELYPLSFHEFINNIGIDPKVVEYVQDCINDCKTIEKTVHESMRSLYLQYLIVGGMPEAVNTFFASHDLNAVRDVQLSILKSIRDDFGRTKDIHGNDKVNEVLKLRAEACLDSMPAQLSKEYKKFQYSLVNAKGNSPEKADGLQYLEDVGLVVRSYNTRELSFPLEGVKISNEFKVFYSDTGLLISQLGPEVSASILSGDISSYKGAIAENMVAAAFIHANRKLYYFHAPSGSPELDFLFEKDGAVHIVECKATNNRATSMKYVISHPDKYGEHIALKFADTNVGKGDNFTTYPLYAIGFLNHDPSGQIIKPIDVWKIKVPEQEG